MAGPIRIAILANASQAQRELNSIAGTTQSLGSKFAKFGKVAAAGLVIAGAAAAKFGYDSVKAASDMQETVAKTETVFGKQSDAIKAWGKTTADAFGISNQAALQGASTFGNFFDQIGIGQKQSASMSKSWVEMSADLASFHNAAPTDVMDALASATRGEYDALQKFIPTINAAAVQQKALAMTGKDSADALTDAEKAAATYQLTIKGQGKAAGDFARTQSSLANQTRILSAKFADFKVKVGNVLLPIITAAMGYILSTAIPAITDFGQSLASGLAPYIDKAQAAFSSLMDSLAPVTEWFASHPEIIKGAGIALGIAAAAALAFAAAMIVVSIATSPITLVVLAIAALGAAVYYAYKNSETFRNAIAAIGQIAMQVFGWLRANVLPILQAIGQFYVAMFNRIKQVTAVVLAVIKGLWSVFGGTITNFLSNTFANLKQIVEGGLKVIKGIIQTVTAVIRGDWSGAWNGIKTILSGAWQAIRGIASQGINMVKSLLSAGWAAVKALTSAAWNGLKSVVSSAVDGLLGIVRGIPGRILGAIGDLGGLLASAGRALIDGLIGGVTDKIGELEGLLNSVTDKIPDWKGPKDKDKNLLRPTGRWIMEGLIKGIEQGSSGVEKVLDRLTDKIEKHFTDKGFKGKALRSAVKSYAAILRNMDNALVANGKAQDKNTARLKATREALKDLIAESKQYAATVKAGVVAFGAIIGLGKQEDGSVVLSSLLDQLRDKAVAAQRYAVLIAQLTAQGLNKTSIQQLIDAGVEGGLATAEALATGGQAAIAEINSLTANLTATGTALGNSVASTMYDAGIAAAQGLIRGLEAQAKRLDKAAIRLANALVRAVKKALGIHSPSKVFAGIGDNVTKGLVIGLDEYRIKKAGESMASTLTTGFGTPALDAFSASSSQSKTTVTLTAEQVSALQRGREIQMDLDAYRAVGGRVAS